MDSMTTLKTDNLLTDEDLTDIARLATAGIARVEDTLALLDLIYHLAAAYGSAMRRMAARQHEARAALDVQGKATKPVLQAAVETARKVLES